MKKIGTYQFKASAKGWNKAKGIIVEDITSETAMKMCNAYALLFGTVARCALVTGYENLNERNEMNETLGNGIYCHPHEARFNLSFE